jgi:ABC-type nitrate/sulfonate/bicarbonate transport system permease component
MDRTWLYQLGTLAVPLAIWQLAVGAFGIVSPSVLPAPLAIAETTVALLGDAGFRSDVFTTLRRTLIASLAGSTLGTVVGLAMGWNRTIKSFLSPLAAAIFPLPMIALLPLLILLFGSNETALIVTAGMGTFFVVLWNAMDGARGIGTVYADVARDNGATSTYRLFREVLLPGSLPLVLVGLRLGVSTSLLIVVAVELVAGSSGLGNFLWVSWMTYQLTDLYAALVVSGVFGVVFTYGLAALHVRLVPWEADVRRNVVL